MAKIDQGVQKERYSLIPRTLIFITREQEVLLIKGAPHKRLWANRYNGIGGHVERGEDILSSARRELLEETNLKVDNLQICGIVTVDTGENIGIGIIFLRGFYQGGELIASEEGSLEWVAIDKLGKLPLVEDLPTMIQKVLSLGVSDPPFAAQYSYDPEDHLVISFGS